jgi:hypothetical protein
VRRLLLVVSWVVHWATRTPRRLIGVLAVPVLVAVALATGPMRDRPEPAPSGPVAAPTTAAPTPSGPRSTQLPAPTGPVPLQSTVPSFRLTPAQEAPAAGYVVAANSHDARPGHDKAFTDSYARAQQYVTPGLFRQIMSADPRRGDYQWRQWVTGKATVLVQVLATGVPDGAPAPTATTAYTRVQFRQTVRPTAGAQAPASTVGVLNMLVTRGSDGHWLVSRLLADV